MNNLKFCKIIQRRAKKKNTKTAQTLFQHFEYLCKVKPNKKCIPKSWQTERFRPSISFNQAPNDMLENMLKSFSNQKSVWLCAEAEKLLHEQFQFEMLLFNVHQSSSGWASFRRSYRNKGKTSTLEFIGPGNPSGLFWLGCRCAHTNVLQTPKWIYWMTWSNYVDNIKR